MNLGVFYLFKRKRQHPDAEQQSGFLRSNAAEILIALVVLAGWAFITSAFALIFNPKFIWLLSTGMLLLALSGFDLLAVLLRKGLYLLSRD